MIFESVTIQLLILSLLLLSTENTHRKTGKHREALFCRAQADGSRPSLCCALRLSSLGAREPSTFLQRNRKTNGKELLIINEVVRVQYEANLQLSNEHRSEEKKQVFGFLTLAF